MTALLLRVRDLAVADYCRFFLAPFRSSCFLLSRSSESRYCSHRRFAMGSSLVETPVPGLVAAEEQDRLAERIERVEDAQRPAAGLDRSSRRGFHPLMADEYGCPSVTPSSSSKRSAWATASASWPSSPLNQRKYSSVPLTEVATLANKPGPISVQADSLAGREAA
jgi:hypothetical protein